jgi:hypothetical protein
VEGGKDNRFIRNLGMVGIFWNTHRGAIQGKGMFEAKLNAMNGMFHDRRREYEQSSCARRKVLASKPQDLLSALPGQACIVTLAGPRRRGSLVPYH